MADPQSSVCDTYFKMKLNSSELSVNIRSFFIQAVIFLKE